MRYTFVVQITHMGFTTLKTGSKVLIKHSGETAEVQLIYSGRYTLKGHPGTFSASDLKTIATRPSQPISRTPIKRTQTPIKRTNVNKVSDKQKHLNDFYKALLVYRNAKNSKCSVGLPGCTKVGDQTHHQYNRTGYWLICFKYTIPICQNCHCFITENSDFAINNGYSISRFEDLHYEIPQHEFDFLWNKFHNSVEKIPHLLKIKTLFTISP